MSLDDLTPPMKLSTERSLSRWTPSIVAILGFAITFGATWNKLESHIEDRNIHATYEKHADLFVPRTELEAIVVQLNEAIRLTVQMTQDSESRTREDMKALGAKLDRIENILLENKNGR